MKISEMQWIIEKRFFDFSENLLKYLQNYQLGKTCLLKCLKGTALEQASIH